MHRASIKTAARLVVKLGTGVLTDSHKQPDPAQLEQLVAQVAALRQAGKEIVLVTSGAVGAGMGALGYAKRPGELAELQACAAVGQSRLMAMYGELFARHHLPVAQVLPLWYVVLAFASPVAVGTASSLIEIIRPGNSSANCETVALLPESAAETGSILMTSAGPTVKPPL